ncbi:tumor necrosis factor receptor superfamily member 6 isoform X4 [Calonectris borealis]|uniref:tumor necrosis factor receptor superfamily member 6 isoform X4 n=1 Tax=Calonectris borealis TaxID=1323832 RepID=UPI003F4B6CAF
MPGGQSGAAAPAQGWLPTPRAPAGRAGKGQLCPLPAAGPSAGAGPPRVYQHGRSRARAAAGCRGGFALPEAAGSGGMPRGLLPLLLVVVLITETQCKNYTEALIHIAYNKLITRRIIAKREIKCNLDEYRDQMSSDGQCCKKCERGFVKNINCPTDTGKHCVPCENGKEYVDHVNSLDKCLRCSSCDSVFGLEVAKNCTPAQNTECTCAKNHFCSSSVPCSHCGPCTICESGVIEYQCTSTSDTVCGRKGTPWWAIALGIALLAILLLAAGGTYLYKRKQKGLTSKENLGEVVPKPEASYGNHGEN